MGKVVYVVIERSIWDYEQAFSSSDVMVCDNFEKAFEEYTQRKNQAMEDMKNFVSEDDIEIEENIEEENAEISIYENGDYTKTHCDIYVIKKEVLSNE